MAYYMQELEQDPFDPEQFVEKLAWRTTGDPGGTIGGPGRITGGPGRTTGGPGRTAGASGLSNKPDEDSFDPMALHDSFEQAIRDLRMLHESTQKKAERLEVMCKEEEKRHWQKVTELQNKNKASFNSFQELDERINFVATKVVHLGDQLESVNTPRSRAVEAQKLMNYFAEFLGPGPVISEVFTDKSQLNQSADVIQKLNLIAQELPSEKFKQAKERIAQKYFEIERSLIEEFVKAHDTDDKARMKEIAGILSHFKGYPQCVDAFILQSQLGAFVRRDIFADVMPLCEKNSRIMKEVFTNPEQVMAKFVLNIYHGKLQEYIQVELTDKSNPEQYLKNLYDLYSKTTKLSNDLTVFNMGNDSAFLSKLTKNIFQRYLDTYISVETRCLKDKCGNILQRFYESKNHQKKPIQSGSIFGIRRNIQASLVTRANINIGPSIENYGGETFVCEEVAINLLQESKMAFKRCQMLSRQSDIPGNAVQIFDILFQYLCVEHIDYALELGLQGIPIGIGESKTPPEIYFFDVVRQCNAIMHLMEKQFSNSLVPLLVSTPKHGECLQKKKDIAEEMELKLDVGLDRTLTAIIGWVKYLLQTEQKKTDFKPEGEDVLDFKPEIEDVFAPIASPACRKVLQFVNSQVEKIRDSLDGKNVEAVLLELGTRFHRVIFEHLQQFQYSSVGAMLVICDVNEYRKCLKEFKIPLLNVLLDTLHALCNLLVVVPDNLKQVWNGDELAGVDKSVKLSFVQLRADYKTARVGNRLK